ncbi:hypothetical protein [Thalassotalea sp. G2M2-11]|uniref:hypothetical protein n=1 Tax=Thalassotalea sp. G2M2-11 TaxID=2787627 RepID=UPI0019CFF6EA|nr:hypothetical protein [Thalassotalea sp. G2M2-11]
MKQLRQIFQQMILNLTGMNLRTICQFGLVLTCAITLSACQLTSTPQTQSIASEYYLWIKTLSHDELRQELAQQQQNEVAGLTQARVNLIFLYAMPDSPVYNPYTAKTLLNRLVTEQSDPLLSSQDYALLNLLREQLNQHILTSNKLLQAKQQLQEQQLKQDMILAKQQETIKKLQEQIKQLTQIELTIEQEQ